MNNIFIISFLCNSDLYFENYKSKKKLIINLVFQIFLLDKNKSIQIYIF